MKVPDLVMGYRQKVGRGRGIRFINLYGCLETLTVEPRNSTESVVNSTDYRYL